MKYYSKMLLLLLLLAPGFGAYAQFSPVRGNGDVKTQNRSVGTFTGLRVERGIDLYISQGNNEKVTIEADGNLLEYITTEVKNGTLVISHERNFVKSKSLKAYVTVRTLRRLEAGGGSDVYSQTVLRADKMYCSASGGSDIKLELDVKNLTVSTSGGSDAILTGMAGTVTVSTSGGSDFKGKDLRSDKVVVEASGGSDAYVYADLELAAHASGGASVYYYGNPKKVSKSTSGGGDVTKR